jgi:hypothetical protein
MKINDVTSALTTNDVIAFKGLFSSPIPLDQAHATVSPYLQDPDLFAIIANELQVKGNGDARKLIVSWLKQNLPELFAEPKQVAPSYESPISSHPDIRED